MLTVIILDLDQ